MTPNPEEAVFIDAVLELGLELRAQSHFAWGLSQEFGFVDRPPHRAHTEAELGRVSEVRVEVLLSGPRPNPATADAVVQWVIPHWDHQYPEWRFRIPQQWDEALARLRWVIAAAEVREATGKTVHIDPLDEARVR